MKLILTVMRDEDTEPVSHSLIQSGFRVTRIASTGGFLRRGQSTMIIGVEDEKVQQAIQVIRDHLSPQAEPDMKRATIFVLPIDAYIQI
jgi:uncharacterized protein YaaQ